MEFGTLKYPNLQSAWQHEALHFTPWLAENLSKLGEVLGLDLELESQEHGVGAFSLDILAHETSSDRRVAIENQLYATDHSHLGQLVTYAAGVDAGIVIWIAAKFRDEHREALDWLNRGEGTTTEYFGVVVELVQIDDSKPAVNFKVVASPNQWSRESKLKAAVAQQNSPKTEMYKLFYQSLIDKLREIHSFTNSRVSQAQNWHTFPTGTTDIGYSAVFTGKSNIRAEIYIDAGSSEQNASIMGLLHEKVPNAQDNFSETLEWEALSNRRACRIALYRSGSILKATGDEARVYEDWFISRLIKLKEVFGPHIASAAQSALLKPVPGNSGADF